MILVGGDLLQVGARQVIVQRQGRYYKIIGRFTGAVAIVSNLIENSLSEVWTDWTGWVILNLQSQVQIKQTRS